MKIKQNYQRKNVADEESKTVGV